MSEIKVYMMDDCEWWATKWGLQETIEFYKKTYELTDNDLDVNEIVECNIDKEGIWEETSDPKDIEKLGNRNDTISNVRVIHGRTIKKPRFGELLRHGESVFKYVPMREALSKIENFQEPFCFAVNYE